MKKIIEKGSKAAARLPFFSVMSSAGQDLESCAEDERESHLPPFSPLLCCRGAVGSGFFGVASMSVDLNDALGGAGGSGHELLSWQLSKLT